MNWLETRIEYLAIVTEAGGAIKVYEQPDGHNLGDDTFTKYMDKVHVSKAESMANI